MFDRKRFTIAAGVIVALVLLYSAAWMGVGFLALHATERWADDQRQHGTTISYAEPFFTGYPLRPVVTFPNISITLPAAAGGWTWQTAGLRASILPWATDDLTLDVTGVHTITGPRTVQLAAQSATLHIHLDNNGANAGKLDAENITAADHAPLWKADRVSLSFVTRGTPEPVSQLVLESDNLTLSDAMPPPLSHTIRRIRLTTELKGAWQEGVLPRALEAWRSAGGDLEVRDVYIDWEPITVAGNGTIALDETLQPMGAFTLKFTGFFAGVDALTTNGTIRPADASLAKIMLGLLAKTPAGGGAPELSLPLTLQDHKILAGPVTLMEIPDVKWPADVILP